MLTCPVPRTLRSNVRCCYRVRSCLHVRGRVDGHIHSRLKPRDPGPTGRRREEDSAGSSRSSAVTFHRGVKPNETRPRSSRRPQVLVAEAAVPPLPRRQVCSSGWVVAGATEDATDGPAAVRWARGYNARPPPQLRKWLSQERARRADGVGRKLQMQFHAHTPDSGAEEERAVKEKSY
ncbi:hypothetical protein MTO96_048118 [Rhipicephalus appendiculatus]